MDKGQKPGTHKGNLQAFAEAIATAPDYGFLRNLFPYPETARYPFHKERAIAKRSFIEQCLASPEIDEQTKDLLGECTIVQASNVCRYIYEESDQEHWPLQDFPNIAPPFESFWLEFAAPAFVNSAEAGVLPWSSQFPMTWGIACRGTDILRQAEAITHDAEYQRFFLASCQQAMQELEGAWRAFMRDHALTDDSPGEAITEALDAEAPEKRAYLADYVPLKHTLALADMGAWEAVHKKMQAELVENRWQVDMYLLCKYRASPDTYRCLGPLWHMQTQVQHNGAVALLDTGQGASRSRPTGDMIEAIERFGRQAGVSEHTAAEVLFEAYSSLFNPAFLAISFLHCKNVSLTERDHAPAARKQRQAPGEQERPFIRYHILNIEPMRRVLKAEGDSQKTGLRRALHIARGHFRHYENGRGLFGKYHGTYWIPQHARGALREGIAPKEYNLQAPRQAPQEANV